jgi:hypothetical protein
MPLVLAEEPERGWLLLADAGTPFESLGNPPALWLKLLPAYAELQRDATVPQTVPDRTLGRWPELYDDLLRSDLPLTESELARLRRLAAPEHGGRRALRAGCDVRVISKATVRHWRIEGSNPSPSAQSGGAPPQGLRC